MTLSSITEDQVLGRSTDANEPDWLRDRRLSAFKTYIDQRWPDRKVDEYWRNTPFARLVDTELELVTSGEGVAADFPGSLVDAIDVPSALARVADGAIVDITVPAEFADAGVTVASLSEAATSHRSIVEKHLGTLTTTGGGTGADEDRTISVNDAMWDAGIFVHVPAEVEVAGPIAIHLHVSRPGAHLPRVLIVLEHHARVSVELQHSSTGLAGHEGITPAKTPAVVSEVVEAIVGDGAHLDLVTLDEHEDDVTLLALQKTQTHRDASVRHMSVDIGGRTTRLRPEVDLVGPGSSCHPIGIYFADEGQHFDVQPYIRHIAPRATSDILYKGALQGNSRTVFRGNVLVERDAVGTNTNETNRNLILTDGARADSTPFLEIHCADITAGHGSATGQIDARQLFYLEARGIPRDQALRLIVLGFFREVLDQFDLPGLEARAIEHLEREIDITDFARVGVSNAAPLTPQES